MTGQQADGVLTALVEDNDSGVARFVDEQRGEDADDDAGRHDADQVVVAVKGFLQVCFKVFFVVEVAGVRGGQLAGKLFAFSGQVEVCG